MSEDRPAESGLVACPQCAERIQPLARICRFCRYDVSGAPATPPTTPAAPSLRPPSPVPKRAPRSAGTALLLALLLPGLGHMYAGRIGTGFALLAVAIVLANATINGSEPGTAVAVLVVFQVTQVVLAFRAASG